MDSAGIHVAWSTPVMAHSTGRTGSSFMTSGRIPKSRSPSIKRMETTPTGPSRKRIGSGNKTRRSVVTTR
jgi:hypothetical protein